MLTERRREALEKMGAGFALDEAHLFHVHAGRTRELKWVIEMITQQIQSINKREGAEDDETTTG